jgi:hypothetical protein
MEISANGTWIMEILKIFFTAILGGAAALWLPFIRRFFWGPKLSLSFGNDLVGCVARTPILYGGQETEGYYFRVKVRNIKPTLAKDCRAFLVGVEKKGDGNKFISTIYQDSIQLQWACRSGQGFSSIDLPIGINQFIDVIAIIKGVDRIDPKIEMLPFIYRNLFSEHGTFRYTVQVSGQELKPDFIRFVFEWNGKWDDFKVELDSTLFYQKTDIQNILKQIKGYFCQLKEKLVR